MALKSKAPRKMYRKRRYARKGKRSTFITNVNKALTPFPQRFITKMKYSQTFALGAANSGTYYFNLNSIWDPDRTGVGHQPYMRDLMATVYNRYRVISCSYNITAYSGGSVVRVAAIPLNEPNLFAGSLSEVCENPRSKWIIQIPGGDTKMIKGKVYIPSLVGRTKAQYMADDRYQATADASPGELAILGIYGADIADSTATIQCTITLNYTVEWFDIKTQGQS